MRDVKQMTFKGNDSFDESPKRDGMHVIFFSGHLSGSGFLCTMTIAIAAQEERDKIRKQLCDRR